MKTLPQKLLTSALKKIAMGRFSSLSGIELRTYFNYRVKKVLATKLLLVRNEVEYLLAETGPGKLRLSPELLQLLPTEDIFVSNKFKDSPERQLLQKHKQDAESYVIKHRNSPETQALIIGALSNYLEGVKLVSTSPLIVNGTYSKISVSCLIKNGEWILPGPELFSFLKNCQTQKIFPLLIAKKISGILFPVFKNLSVLGMNSYKIYLPEGIKPLLEKVKIEDDELNLIKYCNQFSIIHPDPAQDTYPENSKKDPFKLFFETILKNHIFKYQNDFFQSKFIIMNNFLDTVSQFKKNRNTISLIKNYQSQQKLIQELKINFPDQQS